MGLPQQLTLAGNGEVKRRAATALRQRVSVDGKLFARGKRSLRIQGVTYGPFAPNPAGEQFPAPRCVAEDFARMQAAHINSVRVYHTPPEWLLDLADEHDLHVFIDIPWSKHLCFLDSKQALREARQAVATATRCAHHPAVFAYSIGNEISPEHVRWYGRRRIERFLAELMDVAKQAAPEALITYANYPPTEYLGGVRAVLNTRRALSTTTATMRQLVRP